MREEVGKRLGLTPEQMTAIKGTMRDYIHQAVEEWNARVRAGPTTYQQVATVTPWHTLSKGMQEVISQLCMAVDSEKIRAPYVVQYMDLMSRAIDPSPRKHIDDPGPDEVGPTLLCPSHSIA